MLKGRHYMGYFVALEGPDGSGKSTILRLLEEYFADKNDNIVFTREPGGTSIGEEIRQVLLDNKNTVMAYETEALLLAAARAQHVHEKIRPSLKAGKNVICDRFVLSSLAYQGFGRSLGIDEVRHINEFGIKEVFPHMILFFHVDPGLTLKRKMVGLGGDRLEQEGSDFHEKVYEGYMKLLDLYRDKIVLIDASKSIKEVLDDSIEAIEKLLYQGVIL